MPFSKWLPERSAELADEVQCYSENNRPNHAAALSGNRDAGCGDNGVPLQTVLQFEINDEILGHASVTIQGGSYGLCPIAYVNDGPVWRGDPKYPEPDDCRILMSALIQELGWKRGMALVVTPGAHEPNLELECQVLEEFGCAKFPPARIYQLAHARVPAHLGRPMYCYYFSLRSWVSLHCASAKILLSHSGLHPVSLTPA